MDALLQQLSPSFLVFNGIMDSFGGGRSNFIIHIYIYIGWTWKHSSIVTLFPLFDSDFRLFSYIYVLHLLFFVCSKICSLWFVIILLLIILEEELKECEYHLKLLYTEFIVRGSPELSLDCLYSGVVFKNNRNTDPSWAVISNQPLIFSNILLSTNLNQS